MAYRISIITLVQAFDCDIAFSDMATNKGRMTSIPSKNADLLQMGSIRGISIFGAMGIFWNAFVRVTS
jgi:hypothetical protein